jgi:glutathione S-transferase
LHKSFSPLFNPASAVETKAEFAASLKKKYAWVSAQLADKNYLTGDDFTVADAYLFVVTNWTKYVGLDISEFTPLTQFLQRVASRPAVLAALKEEGLIS